MNILICPKYVNTFKPRKDKDGAFYSCANLQRILLQTIVFSTSGFHSNRHKSYET